MKKVLIFFIFCLTLAFAPLVLAQTVSPYTTHTAPGFAARISVFHTICDNSINQRLTNLNDAMNRINAAIRLSSDQKSQYSSKIQSDINGLTALKSKCDGDTDLTTLRADIKSIYTNYRVYAEFLPQIDHMATSDAISVTISKLNDLYTKLQSRVSEAGNPSNLISLLSDMQSKISDAKSQATNIQSQISGLTPSSFDSNPSGTKSIFDSVKSEMATARNDLQIAFSDAKQIISDLKTMKTPTPTS